MRYINLRFTFTYLLTYSPKCCLWYYIKRRHSSKFGVYQSKIVVIILLPSRVTWYFVIAYITTTITMHVVKFQAVCRIPLRLKPTLKTTHNTHAHAFILLIFVNVLLQKLLDVHQLSFQLQLWLKFASSICMWSSGHGLLHTGTYASFYTCNHDDTNQRTGVASGWTRI